MVQIFYTIEARGQGHSCPKMVPYNLYYSDASTQKFDIDATKKCGRNVGDMILSSFEARGHGHSDLKQYATFLYPNMYPKMGFLCHIV